MAAASAIASDAAKGAAIEGGISQIGNLYSGWLNSKGARQANDWNIEHSQRQARWNRENAANQNQWNIDQWHRANEYNSPQAQMQRLKDAGLNPRLIYGSNAGQVSGTANRMANAADVKGYSRPEAKNIYEGIDAFSSKMGGSIASILHADNVAQNTKMQSAETDKKLLEAIGTASDNTVKASKAGISDELAKFNLSIAEEKYNTQVEETRSKQYGNTLNDATLQNKIDTSAQNLRRATAEANTAEVLTGLKNAEKTMLETGTKNAPWYIQTLAQKPELVQKVIRKAQTQGMAPSFITLLTALGRGYIYLKTRGKKSNYSKRKRTPPRLRPLSPNTNFNK